MELIKVRINLEDIESSGTCTLDISGELTIYSVAALKAEFDSIIHSHNRIALDLKGVTEFDSSALQLLMCVRNTIEELTIIDTSLCVYNTLEQAGMQGNFCESH